MNKNSCAIVRAAREAQGLTQAHVADLIGAETATYSAWERGSREVPVDRLGEIARALGVPVALIIYTDASPESVFDSTEKRPDVWRAMNTVFAAELNMVASLVTEITSQPSRLIHENAPKARPRRRRDRRE